jgi:hypothetical protein
MTHPNQATAVHHIILTKLLSRRHISCKVSCSRIHGGDSVKIVRHLETSNWGDMTKNISAEKILEGPSTIGNQIRWVRKKCNINRWQPKTWDEFCEEFLFKKKLFRRSEILCMALNNRFNRISLFPTHVKVGTRSQSNVIKAVASLIKTQKFNLQQYRVLE